ncbi:MAG: cell division protein SepF [Lachnospiraceae bacterium]|nr:cell division protein SepF [Lachnospiraceae bacterium]
MGMFDKILDVMRLNDDDDDYEDDYDDIVEEEEEVKHSKKASRNDVEEEVERPRAFANITPMRGGKKNTSGAGMKVCVIKPTTFEDTREIAETLLAERTVILNMEGIDLALAQRIIDFISGACYAIDGNLQKVSNYIFILTPHSVDITGDLQGIMEAFDFSGIQTGF